MFKNRIAFIGLWLLLLAVLLFFPGFETRGLALGLIVGHLPFIALSYFHITPEYSSPLMVYLAMFVFSGIFVVLSAWLMDKTNHFKGYVLGLVIAILVGAAVFSCGSHNYESWKHSAFVQQAMESPEIQYQPTRWEFNKQIAIPKFIAGGLFGLYFASLCGCIASIAILSIRRFRKSDSPE